MEYIRLDLFILGSGNDTTQTLATDLISNFINPHICWFHLEND